MTRYRYSYMVMLTFILIGLIFTVFTGCEDDPACPDNREPTPTPVSTYTASYRLTLEACQDGLYCSDTFPRKLLIPWPMTTGQEFESAYPDCERTVEYSVFSTDGSYTSNAGTFDEVIQIIRSAGYDSHTIFFKENAGFLGYETVAGRSYLHRSLSRYTVTSGPDELSTRYGLATGNTWVYSIRGSDSNGEYFTEGFEERRCSGGASVPDCREFFMDVEIETATYRLRPASTNKAVPEMLERPVKLN